MMKIREFLWKIGLINKCPKCYSNLIKVGFGNEGTQYYKCSSVSCNWGKE